MQNKLVSAFSEYRLLHKQSSRQLPHNKLLYPPALRYLPLWMLGELQGAESAQPGKCLSAAFEHAVLQHVVDFASCQA